MSSLSTGPQNITAELERLVGLLEDAERALGTRGEGIRSGRDIEHGSDDGSSTGGARSPPTGVDPTAASGPTAAPAGEQSHPISTSFLSQLTRRTQAAAASAIQAASSLTAEVQEDEASVSASAELHRLTSDSTNINITALAEWLAELVPFCLLLLWVVILQHVGVILLILWLATATLRANRDIRRLVASARTRPDAAAARSAAGQAAYIAAFTVAAALLARPDADVLRVLALRGAAPGAGDSVLDALLLVLLADSLLRFAALAPKLALVACFRARQAAAAAGGGGGWAGARAARQQARLLTALECAAGLYRAALPTPIWYAYLLRCGASAPVLASMFAGAYLTLKASTLLSKARLLGLALRTVGRQGALYGTYIGGGGGRGGGEGGGEGTLGACPVCQDCVSTPVRMECGHVFCEECIVEWLERNRTCPMCRAAVRPEGLPAATDGASPLLPQLF